VFDPADQLQIGLGDIAGWSRAEGTVPDTKFLAPNWLGRLAVRYIRRLVRKAEQSA
jgi:hypothetical protein